MLLATETFAPEIGGGERQASLLAHGLLRRGHQVTLLTRRSRRESPAETVVDGLRILRLPPAGAGRRVRWRLQFYALPELVRRRREYDVLLISGYRALGIPGLIAGRWYGKPVVLKADSLGEMSGEFFRAGLGELRIKPEGAVLSGLLRLRARYLRMATAHVAVSAEVERELLTQAVPRERIHRIPNGVDCDAVPAGRAFAETGTSATARLASGSAARLHGPPGELQRLAAAARSLARILRP